MKTNLSIFDEPSKLDEGDGHSFESIGSILKRMRILLEPETDSVFDPARSLALDRILLQEDGMADEEYGA